jgi:hypothetical protein
MPRLVPVEELFKGRHFDQEIVVLCVRWYLKFQAQLSRSGGNDGRAGHRPDAHDDLEDGKKSVVHQRTSGARKILAIKSP